MQNYDVTQKVDYETDDEYRKCLLSVFKLKEFDTELVRRVELLQKETTNETLLLTAKKLGVGFEDDLAFFMLFSFDEFKNTHLILTSTVDCKN